MRDQFGFSKEDLSSVERGEIVSKELSAANSFEVCVAGAMRIAIPYNLAVKSYQDRASFKRNPNVPQIGSFSNPARIEDLKQYTMEEQDIKALKECESGDCPVKLPAELMDKFRSTIDWNSAEYRNAVLSRAKSNFVDYVTAYTTGGNSALMSYNDIQYPQSRADEYHALVMETPNFTEWGKVLYEYLNEPGKTTLANSTMHYVWQKEDFSGAKPTTTIVLDIIYTPDPGKQLALIASKQLYADHFFEASLTVTAIVGSPADSSGIYLVYLNRSNFDDLRKTGIFSFTGRIRKEIVKGVERDLIWVRERIRSAIQAN